MSDASDKTDPTTPPTTPDASPNPAPVPTPPTGPDASPAPYESRLRFLDTPTTPLPGFYPPTSRELPQVPHSDRERMQEGVYTPPTGPDTPGILPPPTGELAYRELVAPDASGESPAPEPLRVTPVLDAQGQLLRYDVPTAPTREPLLSPHFDPDNLPAPAVDPFKPWEWAGSAPVGHVEGSSFDAKAFQQEYEAQPSRQSYQRPASSDPRNAPYGLPPREPAARPVPDESTVCVGDCPTCRGEVKLTRSFHPSWQRGHFSYFCEAARDRDRSWGLEVQTFDSPEEARADLRARKLAKPVIGFDPATLPATDSTVLTVTRPDGNVGELMTTMDEMAEVGDLEWLRQIREPLEGLVGPDVPGASKMHWLPTIQVQSVRRLTRLGSPLPVFDLAAEFDKEIVRNLTPKTEDEQQVAPFPGSGADGFVKKLVITSTPKGPGPNLRLLEGGLKGELPSKRTDDPAFNLVAYREAMLARMEALPAPGAPPFLLEKQREMVAQAKRDAHLTREELEEENQQELDQIRAWGLAVFGSYKEFGKWLATPNAAMADQEPGVLLHSRQVRLLVLQQLRGLRAIHEVVKGQRVELPSGLKVTVVGELDPALLEEVRKDYPTEEAFWARLEKLPEPLRSQVIEKTIEAQNRKVFGNATGPETVFEPSAQEWAALERVQQRRESPKLEGDLPAPDTFFVPSPDALGTATAGEPQVWQGPYVGGVPETRELLQQPAASPVEDHWQNHDPSPGVAFAPAFGKGDRVRWTNPHGELTAGPFRVERIGEFVRPYSWVELVQESDESKCLALYYEVKRWEDQPAQ